MVEGGVKLLQRKEMIFTRNIHESKILYGNTDFPVYKNPTKEEMQAVFNATAGEAKGLMLRNGGDVYVWPSLYNTSEHSEVFNELNIKEQDVWITFYMWMNPSAFFRLYRGDSIDVSADFDVFIKTSVSSNVRFGLFSRVVDKWSTQLGAKLRNIPGAHWITLPAGLYDLDTLQQVKVGNTYEAMKTVLLGEYKDDI